MDKINIDFLQNKISLYEHVLDCLIIKLFYLESKSFKSEFEDNNNRLEIIKVSHYIQVQKGKLLFLNSEFVINFELYKS
jgi:hypothetical protein